MNFSEDPEAQATALEPDGPMGAVEPVESVEPVELIEVVELTEKIEEVAATESHEKCGKQATVLDDGESLELDVGSQPQPEDAESSADMDAPDPEPPSESAVGVPTQDGAGASEDKNAVSASEPDSEKPLQNTVSTLSNPALPVVDAPSRAAARRSRRAAEYDTRAGELEALLRTSTMRLDPKLVASGLVDLEVVRGRLALGVDSTVVAFAGGTGSGKSSLFNAISGVRFADVGVRRPTTSQVTACYWGPPVEPLLDWLEVLPSRRHQRESILDADDETEMHGLVLLDLPDHDSIVDANRFEVDRLLPKIDLLIWVVDPQKYADQALHAGYLQELVGHEGSLLVLLNQVDTLQDDAVEPVLEDIARLLFEDGLESVSIVPVSAKTGAGLPWVRDRIEKVVSRASKCAERADAALTIAATRLEDGLGESSVTAADLPIDATRVELAAAAGVEQLAESAGLQRVNGVARSPVPPIHVQRDRVDRARNLMIDAASVGLPSYWVEYLDIVIADVDTIAENTSRSLSEVMVPVRRSIWHRAFGVLALISASVAIAVTVWLGLVAFGVVSRPPGIGTRLASILGSQYELPALVWILALLLGGLSWWLHFSIGKSTARSVSWSRRAELESGIARVVASDLVGPIANVLDEHREIRERLAAIAGEPIRAADVVEPDDMAARVK